MNNVVAHIESHCLKHSIKLTSLRKLIILLLSEQNQPITAYELLAKLNEQSKDKNYNIMSIYRVLDFLCQNELIHRIHTTNCYTICCHPEKHICQLFICKNCGTKIEQHDEQLDQTLQKLAQKSAFAISQHTIELFGLCHKCLSFAI